jgi:CheY-like chemotaxis protein
VIPDSEYFPSARQGRTILVVEDEALVRMVMADDLRAAGYVVIECATGDEAWDLLNSGVEVDLLFSDVQVPGRLDGLALAHAVREYFSDIPIVIASAHLPPAAAADFDAFLQKPFPFRLATRQVDALLKETANDRQETEPE